MTGKAQITAVVMMPAPPAGFDYAGVPANKASALRAQADRIRKLVRNTTAAIINIGRDLISVKEQLDHGQFTAWVEAECGFTLRTAENYVRAAEFAEGKNETVSLLNPATVYRLASKRAPAEVVDAVIQRVTKGEAVSDNDVVTALDEAKFQKRKQSDQAAAAKRRRPPSKSILARQERARLQELDRQRAEDEKFQSTAQEIIDTIGAENAKFLLRVIPYADHWWTIKKKLGAQLGVEVD